MKKIPLSQGKFALVDDDDFERVSKWKWSYFKAQDGCERAVRNNGKTSVYLHRFLVEPPKGYEVDHIDHDGLNNQKSNLRIATRSQNAANRRLQSNNTSGYIGVSKLKGKQKWLSYAKKNGKSFNLGCYDTPEEAARVRDKKIKELHAEFASTNGYSLG